MIDEVIEEWLTRFGDAFLAACSWLGVLKPKESK